MKMEASTNIYIYIYIYNFTGSIILDGEVLRPGMVLILEP